MTAQNQQQKEQKAIAITRIVGWGAIVFSLFTVVTVIYVGFIQ